MSDNLKYKAISNTAWKFAERFCAQGVSILVSIILARILSPDDFGVVSIVTIFFSFANIFITSGLNTALIQKKDADWEDYSSVLLASITVSLIIYIILFFSSPYIALSYGKKELTSIFRIMGMILPVNAIKSVVCAYISSALQFKKFFFATIVGTLISAIIGICMAINNFGAWALVAQQMSNTLIDTLILVLTTKISFVCKFSFKKFFPLFNYGWKVLVSSFLDTLYTQISPLFIGIKYSSADLSFYNRGQSLPVALTGMVNSTLSATLFPVLSKVQDKCEMLLSYTRRFIMLSSYLVFPLMMGFFAVSDTMVRVILTDKWIPAVIYIRIFCLSSMFTMIATGNCETIKAMGRSDIYLKIEIIKKACYFLTIGIFIVVSHSPITLAFSSIVCTVIQIAVNTFPNRKLLGYRYRLQIIDILPNLFISIVMAAIIMLMNRIPINNIVLLGVQVICGIGLYLFLSIITKNKAYVYLKGILYGVFIAVRQRHTHANESKSS